MTDEHDGPALGDEVLAALSDGADAADARDDWPAASWQLLDRAGVLGWGIPTAFGGRGLGPVEVLAGYERLAGACLTTTFILSQRDAAVRRLLAHGSPRQHACFLPGLAAGAGVWTVGLSQLTTSRQHRAPSLVATPDGPGRFRLDGLIPWVTAADRADVLVAGATLADGRQLLVLLPPTLPGVTVEPPLPLMALAGSRTAQVRCAGVAVGDDEVLAGPAEQVLGTGKVGAGGLETSCLALGLAGAAVDQLHEEARTRTELREVVERFERPRQALRGRLHHLAAGGDNAALTGLRVDCTRLLLQATQVGLAVAKGTGFVRPHPAQRWARQALFFLVWSCPRPAAEGIIAHLLPG